MKKQNNKNLFNKVYKIVRDVPEGKVTTYGDISMRLSSEVGVPSKRWARMVGFALHANTDSHTPCHRVVNKEGRIAPGFAFGGPDEQRKRLEAEGVRFLDRTHVDLQKHAISIHSS